MSVNPSGLSDAHRIQARDLAVKAAVLGLKNQATLVYGENAQRWQGINEDLKAFRNQCPQHADCSAFVTWCLWNGLDHFNVRDTVNGQGWKAGYTGTMVDVMEHIKNGYLLRADAIIYGDPFGSTGHTALYVGGLKVISFGGEPGPRLLPWNYRPVTAILRGI